MSRMGSFDSRELRKLQEHLNRVNEQEINDFVESCAKELAARLIAKVVKRTPVGDYTKKVEVIAKRDGKRHKKGEKYIKRINSTEKKAAHFGVAGLAKHRMKQKAEKEVRRKMKFWIMFMDLKLYVQMK